MTFTFSMPLRSALFCAVVAFSHSGFAQSTNTVLLAEAAKPVAPVAESQNRGKTAAEQDAANLKRWSVYWGWNRSNYSESDIHFTGVDHDFTIKNVQATDLQSEASIEGLRQYFLNPAGMTIPQTNLRIAYQWDSNTAIALNLDHMKYVVVQEQSVPIVGQIGGVPQSGTQVIADKWLNYEHTDGLNILSLEYEKQRPVDWFGPNRHTKLFALVGLGIVIPKTNVTMHMINQVRNDEFHLAGYSAGVGAGLELDVYKDVFFRTAYKYGYVNLPDVLTSARGDKASQHFTYNELLIAIGFRF
jgi:hypothetical protein